VERQLYSIARKDGGKWVISAHGKEVLVCSHKSVALYTIKEATKLLKQAAPPRPLVPADCCVNPRQDCEDGESRKDETDPERS
jgi:hypothetical protein